MISKIVSHARKTYEITLGCTVSYSDSKGKFNKNEFDMLSRLEKRFVYLLCKILQGP